MKNIKHFFTKFICVLLLTACLTNTVYIDFNVPVVHAAEIAGTIEILEALLAAFGISIGLGNQSDYFSQSTFNDLSTAISNGHVYHMDKYGNVDFSDSDSIMNWLSWSEGIDQYVRATGDAPVAIYDAAIKTGAMTIDYASYKMTGTSATNSIHNCIEQLIGDYNGSSEALAEDVRDTFTVITGGAGNNDDDNDDNEKNKKKYMTRYQVFTAIMGATMLTLGDKLTSLVGFKHPDNSEFSEYDAVFAEGFDGTYHTDISGQYICDVYYEGNGGIDNGYEICKYKWHYVGARKIFGYLYDSGATKRCIFGYFLDTPTASNYKTITIGSGIQINLTSGKGGGLSDKSAVSVLFESSSSNVPIFSSFDAAIDYFSIGDTSDILNLKDTAAYANFKNNAISALDRLARGFKTWIMAPKYLKKIPSMLKPVLDAADASAGIANSIDAVEDALIEIAPVPLPDPDPDPVPDPDPLPGPDPVPNPNPVPDPDPNPNPNPDPVPVPDPDPPEPKPPDTDDPIGPPNLGVLNIFLLFGYILYMLLMIFLHLLEFIINIFKIPADRGFLGYGYVFEGFNYIKTVELIGMGVTIYDFLMLLIHIMIIFNVVKVLRKRIEKFHF